ncbi:hypothetical protein [Deinococcus aetherius]|uniref:hypothetical protein n=1 Tax=Deinococcus aetherius TaxID=200252 RepID=UPI0022302848|nr:hypothetical protein [Deinococcus aetherius]
MILPLAAALLSGCTGVTPIEVRVPTDPLVLRGTYQGVMRELRSDGSGSEVTAQLTSTAAYVSKTQCRANGTLNVAGRTYTFTGLRTGDLVTFTAQWSPRYSGIDFEADILLNGEKVGLLMGDFSVPSPPQTRLCVALNNQAYALVVDREEQPFLLHCSSSTTAPPPAWSVR